MNYKDKGTKHKKKKKKKKKKKRLGLLSIENDVKHESPGESDKHKNCPEKGEN